MPPAGVLAAPALAAGLAAASLWWHGPWLTACGLAVVLATLLAHAALRASARLDALDAAVGLIALACALSFAPLAAARVAVAAALLIAAPVGAARLRADGWTAPALSEQLTWAALFLVVLALGWQDASGYHVYDRHPVYELSIARSYDAASPLAAPDLSYAGKTVRFHFLTTRLPLLFAGLCGVELLPATYVLANLFLAVLAALALHAFLAAHPDLRAPVALLFVLPFNAYAGDAWNTVLETLALKTASCFAGGVLFVAALHQLIAGRHAALVCTAFVLIVTKASFFVTLLGGAALLAVRWRSKAVSGVTAVLVVMLVLVHRALYAGAHAHNLWMLFPSFLYAHLAWSAGPESVATIALTLALIGIALHAYLRGEGAAVQAAAAVSLSGLLGITLLTEVAEFNQRQFAIAAYVPLGCLVVRWIRALAPRRALCAAVVVAYGAVALAGAASLAERAARHHRRGGQPDYEADLIAAYTWLAGAGGEGVVLHGKHYELDPRSPRWPPSITHVRSALSGRQLLCEEVKFKGVVMEPDFVARTADGLRFYETFVVSSDASRRALAVFRAPELGAAEPSPLSRSPRRSHRLMHRLSGGREWCWINMAAQVDRGIRDGLAVPAPDSAWMIRFLARHRIAYVVLENGDAPRPVLAPIAREVYRRGSVTVLKVELSG